MQCRTDPMSTLFCQTLSKKLETPISSIRTSPKPTTKKAPSQKDTYLPCNEVYQTLSRHHNFNKMSLESIVDGLAGGGIGGMGFGEGGVRGWWRGLDRG